MDNLFEQGIRFFNKGFYFEAHDTFEEIWMDERGPAKKFYQGLVQLSTGFYHLGMGNFKGALSQLRKSTEKLSAFEPAYGGLELSVLLDRVRVCITLIEEMSEEAFSFEKFKPYIPTL